MGNFAQTIFVGTATQSRRPAGIAVRRSSGAAWRQSLLRLSLGLLLYPSACLAMQADDLAADVRVNIPVQVLQAVSTFAEAARYRFIAPLNPFYLNGDFDGDHVIDCAVLIRQASDEKSGIAIVNGATHRVSIIAAGRPFGDGGDDFSWMDAWTITPGVAGKPDLLVVMKTESASAAIEWTGKTYRWRQLGD
ncbi:MAG: hypothetical protein ABI411_17985 [Tahibacter sp.]